MKQINNRGFTLIELMITLAMTGIIVAAVYSVYTVQSRAYGKQEQIGNIQQTLSAAVFLMTQDLRMAGFDMDSGKGFTTAKAQEFTFERDDSAETITYKFNRPQLTRNSGGGDQTLADNIEAVEFLYTLADGTSTTAPTALKKIRAVTVSVLGIADKPDASFTNQTAYLPGSNDATFAPAANDHYRRRMLITTINCRNMGL